LFGRWIADQWQLEEVTHSGLRKPPVTAISGANIDKTMQQVT